MTNDKSTREQRESDDNYNELADMNETRLRLAEHMPIPANVLLTRYQRLCEAYEARLLTQSTAEPVCPSCNAVQTQWIDYIDMDDADQAFFYECESCQHNFRIRMQTVFTSTK